MRKFRKRINESKENLKKRIHTINTIDMALQNAKFYKDKKYDILYDNSSIDDYKTLLDNNNIKYIEITFTKKSGNKCKMVIPECIFKTMSKAKIDRLLKGMK